VLRNASPSRIADRRAAKNGSPPVLRNVARFVSAHVQCMLWGKAAGRCEFAGCNKPLWKSSVTQEQVNIAQKAHIYAFSSHGPRGNRAITNEYLNSLANLMLVCHECHRKIDRQLDGGRYSASPLQKMKAEHEARIELVTRIQPSKKSHIILFGANICDHGSPLDYYEAAWALFPARYPATDAPIELSTINSSFSDRDTSFWAAEAENLERKFGTRVRDPLSNGQIGHLSVFALAPQPLLILLGTLLGDIVLADIYQRHREPQTWRWPRVRSVPKFFLQEPTEVSGTPVLVVATSATVTRERITRLLGDDARIWTVTVRNPHNNIFKSREQLSQLRSLLRSVLDHIKTICGQTTPLHIFPATSVSAAVELGRVRMPKADMPWRIYDQINERGGFVEALSVPRGGG
jgi:hypothetical protein